MPERMQNSFYMPEKLTDWNVTVGITRRKVIVAAWCWNTYINMFGAKRLWNICHKVHVGGIWQTVCNEVANNFQLFVKERKNCEILQHSCKSFLLAKALCHGKAHQSKLQLALFLNGWAEKPKAQMVSVLRSTWLKNANSTPDCSLRALPAQLLKVPIQPVLGQDCRSLLFIAACHKQSYTCKAETLRWDVRLRKHVQLQKVHSTWLSQGASSRVKDKIKFEKPGLPTWTGWLRKWWVGFVEKTISELLWHLWDFLLLPSQSLQAKWTQTDPRKIIGTDRHGTKVH